MSGWRSRHCSHVVHTSPNSRSDRVPGPGFHGPGIDVASICGHHASVARSYITRLLLISRPETPKVVSPRSNPWTVPVSGQYVTVTGRSPRLSLTISCWTRIFRGYALTAPFSATPNTGSPGSRKSTPSAPTNAGSSIEGIPSFGGSPETASDSKSPGSRDSDNTSSVVGIGASASPWPSPYRSRSGCPPIRRLRRPHTPRAHRVRPPRRTGVE